MYGQISQKGSSDYADDPKRKTGVINERIRMGVRLLPSEDCAVVSRFISGNSRISFTNQIVDKQGETKGKQLVRFMDEQDPIKHMSGYYAGSHP